MLKIKHIWTRLQRQILHLCLNLFPTYLRKTDILEAQPLTLLHHTVQIGPRDCHIDKFKIFHFLALENFGCETQLTHVEVVHHHEQLLAEDVLEDPGSVDIFREVVVEE